MHVRHILGFAGDSSSACAGKADAESCALGFETGYLLGCSTRCDDSAADVEFLKIPDVMNASCGEENGPAKSSCDEGFEAGVDAGASAAGDGAHLEL